METRWSSGQRERPVIAGLAAAHLGQTGNSRRVHTNLIKRPRRQSLDSGDNIDDILPQRKGLRISLSIIQYKECL